MNMLYKIDSLKIKSIIRVASECQEGNEIIYSPICNSYELIYILSGHGKVTFQNTVTDDLPGTIRLLPKNATNNLYKVKNIQSGECIDVFFDTSSPMPTLIQSKNFQQNMEIKKLFLKMYNIWNEKKVGYNNKCLSLFFDILSKMENSSSKYYNSSHIMKISPALEYIHSNYTNCDFEYIKLSGLCGVSYTYFKRIFTEIYGISPHAYVRGLQMQQACELLTIGHFSVAQVAEMCGFSDIYYFSRVFKQEIGISPSKYKS